MIRRASISHGSRSTASADKHMREARARMLKAATDTRSSDRNEYFIKQFIKFIMRNEGVNGSSVDFSAFRAFPSPPLRNIELASGPEMKSCESSAPRQTIAYR
jgi:hypothetical protein